MHPLLEFVLLLCKVFFYYIEAFVRLFKPHPRKEIRGQNVLITGGGRGIGRALAVKFSAEDANIILWDLDKDGLKETAEDLRIRGATVHTYECDVTDKDAVKKTATDVRRDVGDVDILVNNAGVLIGKYMMDLDEKDIRKTFEVNTISHFWTVKECLPAMISRKFGHIVTIASMAGKAGSPMLIDYSASKFAAVGFADALHLEVRAMHPNAHINHTTVCPMFVNTNLIYGDEVRRRVTYVDRFGELLQPDHVAERVVDGVLRNNRYVYIPKSASSVDVSQALLPEKARLAFNDFLSVRFVPAPK